jgi:hypothetical protein
MAHSKHDRNDDHARALHINEFTTSFKAAHTSQTKTAKQLWNGAVKNELDFGNKCANPEIAVDIILVRSPSDLVRPHPTSLSFFFSDYVLVQECRDGQVYLVTFFLQRSRTF